jgi:uncharacterized protein (DUF58 family)
VGWVQALGALLAGFLAVGLGGGALAVRRARAVVTAAPADAAVGQPALLRLAVSRPVEVRPLDPPGPVVLTGGRDEVAVTVEPERRGVKETCTLQLASAAPFGLLWWRVTLEAPLPRAMAVAPRRGPSRPVSRDARAGQGEDDTRSEARVGEPRGVREYRPGDLRRLIHWPATAHAGTLMVREMEAPGDRPVVLVADLPADPEAAEAQAEVLMGTLCDLLGRGVPVRLVSWEDDGRHDDLVSSFAEAGRRLARAVPAGAP